jgi:hypothetical protein
MWFDYRVRQKDGQIQKTCLKIQEKTKRKETSNYNSFFVIICC